jgi:hypothetical protein
MNRKIKDKAKRLQGEPQRRLLVIRNLRFARRKWELSRGQAAMLKELTEELELSVPAGHLTLIDGNWYVTHAGLLRIARRSHCSGIRVSPVKEFSDIGSGSWVFKAVVYRSPRSRGFVGYGDADPSNVSSLVRGAEMRIAETRAVNRALRKAYGIGLCSVEELGTPRSSGPVTSNHRESSSNGTNGHHNGQPRLRDRLCLLIRQHQLDATLVKAFAADYCGAPVLRDASRESVEAFINDLAQRAATDRDGLLSHLKTYAKSTEVTQ